MAIVSPIFFDGFKPFELFEPAQRRVPFLFNSPHSGRVYFDSFMKQTQLDARTIRLSEDAFVDKLFSQVVRQGACFMKANVPRAYIDFNRGPYELDQRLFEFELPPHLIAHSTRAKAGLGTIPRIVALGREIYHSYISLQEAINRINSYYFPYHQALERQLKSLANQFGFVVLIDCHSMPSTIVNDISLPDFIIGDRYGLSCIPELTYSAASFLETRGYSVALNTPYAGGYITEHYGLPHEGVNALQIEINRKIYMDELTIEQTQGFARLQIDMMDLASFIMSIPETSFHYYESAAE